MRPLRTAMSALAITTLTAVGFATAPIAPAEAVEQAGRHTRGVDVSTYDRGFDFTQNWVQFGFAKATQDTDYRDPTFDRNWRAMKQAGIVRGAYHYGNPATNPVEQAEHFLATVRQRGLDRGDLLVLDLEETEGRSTEQVNRWAKRWLSHVRSETGTRPMFYSSWSFAEQHGAGLRDYPLWVAHYDEPRGQVEAPDPWDRWYVHQYAATSHDFNVASVPADRLRTLGYQPDRPAERTDDEANTDRRDEPGKQQPRTTPDGPANADDEQGFWEWLLPWA